MKVGSIRRGRPVPHEDAPLPSGGVRYQTSMAKQMDDALRRGGTLGTIAERLGVTPTALRAHIKHRVESGQWEFTVRKSYTRAGREVVTAGRLKRIAP